MHRQFPTMLFQPELRQAGQPQAAAWSPSQPSRPRTHRASNDDRQHVTVQLQAHYVAGRLSSSELGDRVQQALAAVTLGDLDAVLADLPPLTAGGATPAASPHAAPYDHLFRARGPHGERSFRAHATSYLLVMAMLVAIWALTTPGGYFWPVWPMLGWGIGLATHGLAERSRQTSGSRQSSVFSESGVRSQESGVRRAYISVNGSEARKLLLSSRLQRACERNGGI